MSVHVLALIYILCGCFHWQRKQLKVVGFYGHLENISNAKIEFLYGAMCCNEANCNVYMLHGIISGYWLMHMEMLLLLGI